MLKDELIEELLKHSDPKVAGAAQTLKDLKASGQYIPKAKFDELNTTLKALKDAHAAEIAEAQHKADEAERRALAASASGDISAQEARRLAEERKQQLELLKAEHEKLKPSATAYEVYRKAKVEKLKEKLGDKFLPEYETFSVESLEKLTAADTVVPTTDNNQPGKLFKKPLSDQTPAEFERTLADAKAGKIKKE